MRELYIVAKPVMFNYSGAIVEDGFLVKEVSVIPTEAIALNNYAAENDIDCVVLCGNTSYTSGLKKILENNQTQYNRKIKIRLEEVKG